MICASVSKLSALSEAVDSGAGLIELRLDLIGIHPSELYPLIPAEIRTIVTCRPGVFSEEDRLERLKAGMSLGAAYVDLELETPAGDMEQLLSKARQEKCKVIISYHDYIRTADREDLESIMLACYERGGDIAKIATQVNAPEDIRNLLSLYDLPGKKVILGMGPEGKITRLIGPYLGAEFTFASTGKGEETAPGQLSVKQLNDIYKMINES